MKKTSIFRIVILLFAFQISFFTSYAQAPQSFSYQAVARDNNGNVLINKNLSMRISLLQGSVSGSSVYSETHSVTTDNTGIINLAIGGGTKVSGDFNSINWGSGSYFVKVEMDANNGSNFLVMGTSQLLSVPYALYAKNSGSIGVVGTNVGDVLSWDGTSWVATSIGNASNNLPEITTVVASNIIDTTASSGGTITKDGGYSITAKGVCWSTNPNPTIADSKTSDGIGASAFSSKLQGLLSNTTYYYRAYASNSKGTSYGISYSFTTERSIPKIDFDGVLYVSPMDNSVATWSSSHTLTGATSTTDGKANTTKIVNSIGTNGGVAYAAKVCDTLNFAGYSDWYLPSKDELNALYLNKASIGGFGDNSYWSSTEYDNSYAWYQYFLNGTQFSNNYEILKSYMIYVRCVRR